MTGLHHMLVHFPIAFWALAALLIVLAVVGRGRAAQIAQASLLPLLLPLSCRCCSLGYNFCCLCLASLKKLALPLS